ncbi:hypothetical protein BV349_03925 [Pseudomonas syringae pv. actinidiae]|nr:hypothetical protein BV349_03925 [Pseudomonas syringae pv. actinidiae]OSN75248.1 hypothetical protein BV351_03875 [Pseudomonas syringae pv. actinidiae]RMS14021.1 hypothetical protein ALP75_203233 [Pseudomonas syringae pv. actinidiae]
MHYHAERGNEKIRYTVYTGFKAASQPIAAVVTSESSHALRAEAGHHPPFHTPLESPISAFCKNVPQTARILENTAGHTLMRAFPSPESDKGVP